MLIALDGDGAVLVDHKFVPWVQFVGAAVGDGNIALSILEDLLGVHNLVRIVGISQVALLVEQERHSVNQRGILSMDSNDLVVVIFCLFPGVADGSGIVNTK